MRSAIAQNDYGYDYLTPQLSSKIVMTLAQDKKGYLWIGTDDGLNRYDGYSMTIFRNNPDDSTTIQENEVRAIAIDSAGNPWIGHLNGNISIFDQSTGRFRSFNAPLLGIPKDGIAKIFFDTKGQLWVCVYRNGLFRYDKSINRFIKIGDLPDIHPAYKRILRDYENYNTIYDIHDDGTGLLWLATHDGLYQYNQHTQELKSVRQEKVKPFTNRHDLFNRILASDNGYWMTSWGGGLVFYNPKTQEWKNYRPVPGEETLGNVNILQGMEWKNKDHIWVSGSDFGLGYFDIKKEKFIFFHTKMCRQLIKDKTGILWATSDIDGLLKFDPVNLLSFNKVNVSRTDNGEFYSVSSFYHDIKKQTLYFGTSFGDGLHVLDESTGKESTYGFDRLETAEKALVISSIYKDNRDTLWILTRDFIYWFDDDLKQLRKFKQPYGDKDLRSQITTEFSRMLRAQNGDLWITSDNDGTFRFDERKQRFINYRSSGYGDSLKVYAPRELVEDNKGRIWILTVRGLSIYNYQTKKFTTYFDNHSEASEKIHLSRMTKSPNGDIWISSDDGIYQYNHSSDSISFTHWTSKDGLPSAKINNVKSTSNGGIWLCASSGLFYLDPFQKKTFPTTIIPSPLPYTLYIDDANNIYMGNFRGYNKYSGDAYLTNIAPPRLSITSFRVNNNEFLRGELPQKQVELRYNQNAITIEFSAFDFRNPSNVKYRYFLEGLDSRWTTYVGQHLVNYENLPPGEFTFKVQASSIEGVWTKPIEIPIKIAPPFWGTWYFQVTASLLISVLIYFLYQWRIHKIRYEEKIKSEFSKQMLESEMRSLRAQMNPHFIFNSLNSINKFILLANPETASFYLTKFSRLIRLILENSGQSKISLEQDLTALTHYIELELLRFDHRFSYLIDVDPRLDTASTQIPPLIIQPYVENAIWHGFVKKDHHGKLTITVKKERENLMSITVEDNGVGRNYKKNTLTSGNKKSHGLALTADRIKLLSQGNEEVSSVEIIDLKNEKDGPKGTKVVIRLATPVIIKKTVEN